MQVYLLRHGDAVPAEVDPSRPLSKLGDAEITDTILMQVADGPKIAEIWHSPKLRAKQSAQITGRMLGVKTVIEKPGLKPDDPVEPIADELRQASSGSEARFEKRDALRDTIDALQNTFRPRTTHNAPQSLMIVGHLPFLPKLAALLDPKLGKVELESVGVVRIKLVRMK